MALLAFQASIATHCIGVFRCLMAYALCKYVDHNRPKHRTGMVELGVPWKSYWHTHFLADQLILFQPEGRLAPLNFGLSAVPGVLVIHTVIYKLSNAIFDRWLHPCNCIGSCILTFVLTVENAP